MIESADRKGLRRLECPFNADHDRMYKIYARPTKYAGARE